MGTVGVLRRPTHTLIVTWEDLTPLRADNRVSAYVYGDVLVLAATAGVYDDAIRSGEALLVAVGTVVSTYVALVLADLVGAVFSGHEVRTALLNALRDSIPIISAGIPPLVLFTAAMLGWPTSAWARRCPQRCWSCAWAPSASSTPPQAAHRVVPRGLFRDRGGRSRRDRRSGQARAPALSNFTTVAPRSSRSSRVISRSPPP